MNTMSILEIDGVSKKIGKNAILKDISFTVNKGEIFGLIGPNGSGKTTLIRLICGLMKIDSGNIKIVGHSISSQFEEGIRHVGAIIENPQFYDYLTGYQNLQHFANMYGNISSKRIEEVVRLVKLTNRIHDKVDTYSLGMKQRLGIAQAILHRPSILVLDEPTNGLDPAGIRELRDHLRYLSKNENISIVISTHLLNEVEMLCNRIAVIQTGVILEVRQLNKEEDFAKVTVSIEVDELEKATHLLKNRFPYLKVVDNVLTVETKKEEIPDINQLLVTNEIRVYKLFYSNATLEDDFLQLTRSQEEG